MTTLVTGGAGFIGSHLVRRIVASGERVRVVDDLSTGSVARLTTVQEQIEFAQIDLATADLTSVVAGIDAVYHLAAIPSVPRSVRDPLPTNSSIVIGTLRLLIAATKAGASRFVHSSSSSVYGDTEISPKTENLPPRPLSPYAVAKLAAEGYVRVWSSIYGLPTVTLRYFNVFGPGQDPASQYAAVIPRFITAALRGDSVAVFGDGKQTRDFTYVENVVDANVRARSASVSGCIYNIAAGEPHSVLELVTSLERVLQRPIGVRHEATRPGDILHSHADITSAERDLGWRPAVAFEEGLRRTVEWFAT